MCSLHMTPISSKEYNTGSVLKKLVGYSQQRLCSNIYLHCVKCTSPQVCVTLVKAALQRVFRGSEGDFTASKKKDISNVSIILVEQMGLNNH